MITERQLIEIAALELAARHGFPDRKEMKQRDFEHLCTRIEETSGILISLSTIKRIMNGEFARLPQVATLNALAIYLGYAEWQAFKQAKRQSVPAPAPSVPHSPAAITPDQTSPNPNSPNPNSPAATPPKTTPQKTIPQKITPPKTIRPVLTISLFLLALTVLVLLSWRLFSPAPAADTRLATFTVRKTTANAIPNTVVFTYDISSLKGDSFFIQQSWDKDRRVRITKKNHTLTDIYYEPGYHTAKLFAGDKIIKTLDVSIPTDRWFFYSKEALNKGLPTYIHSADPLHNNILGIDKQDILDSHLDPQKHQVYLYTYFPSNITADADNFYLTASIKITDLTSTNCPWVMPEIFCQRNFMYFTATLPGCTGAINAQFGEHNLSGKQNDLSGLSCDVHEWHTYELLVRRREAHVSIDGKEIFKSAYTTTAGLITGLGFHSNSLCQVKDIQLKGLDGQIVYLSSLR